LNRFYTYILAVVLTLIGLGLFAYKAFVVGFPISPRSEVQTWTVEARVKFTAESRPVKMSMFLPSSSGLFAIANEQFVSEGYGFVLSRKDGNRQGKWSIRKAVGKQTLYYQATMVRVRTKAANGAEKAPKTAGDKLKGPVLAASKSVLKEIREKSADTPTMVEALIKRLNRPDPDENVKILLGAKPTVQKRVKMSVRVLALADLPSRMVHGVVLREGTNTLLKKTRMITWLEVYHKKKWISFDPTSGASPVSDNRMRWWHGPDALTNLEGGKDLRLTLSVSPKVEETITAAVRRGQVVNPLLLKFSLLGLPVNTQAVYRIMLLVPVGAVLLVLLRNVVGIKTFGTFMPVLVGLSFRETGLVKGIFLFVLLVGVGLTVRFCLERLKLLVVPRLAAVLIVVVISMALLSIITHRLGGHTGLSVALFPMVILTMIIERMSVVWEERGATEALVSGLGSLVTAALAFLIMNVKYVEHLVFVFPELLLVLLAITILMGRYTGYRLSDLYRFRELAKV
jgi:7 transmembrane helices usually fused to an inactive transglutaminase/Inactive transglutaminase fused to 7 transmembrane helices